MMSEEITKLLSEKEAGEFLGFKIDKMRQIRKSGQIEYYQFSPQSFKYSVEQLETYKNKFLKTVS